MARGGARPGAGRKPGSVTLKTRAVADGAMDDGLTPLQYMLSILRDETADPEKRYQAAKDSAPYMHSRLSAVEATGKDGADLFPAIRVAFEN